MSVLGLLSMMLAVANVEYCVATDSQACSMQEAEPIYNSALAAEDDVPYVKVEQMPSFQGGDLMTFRHWVTKQIQYPEIAKKHNITGRVLLTFVIERDGSLTNIRVLQSPDSSLSDEVIRVLKSSPKWTPGMQRGEVVRVKYTMPVDFRL